ncbi:hypothetical protein ILUMI_06443 [Ignelater luminosus]|uniref:Uncharacterized protein n=1 Tax=Ignelater luminosus TaxID=2038154 RepID=A0A8K0D590_IGNLU|nr:hypothetical protein ILUMI_06443 [Ignelater luminosus]
MERWREYFQELLAVEGEEQQNTHDVNDKDDKTITTEELTKILQKLKKYSLLSTARKIYKSILTEKLKNETESKVMKELDGFRTDRGTTDAVIVVKQLVERAIDTGEELNTCIIDIKAGGVQFSG